MFYTIIKNIVKVALNIRYKITVIGEENIPDSGPVIIASMHKSELDPPLVAVTIKRELSFFAKEELFKIPVLGFIISRLNAFPVSRGKSDRAALKKSVEVLEQGNMLLIFPEGTRSKTDELGAFQEGASFIAMKSNAQIVPTAILGKYDRKEGVTVIYGPPIDVPTHSESGVKRKELTGILHDEVLKLKNSAQKS